MCRSRWLFIILSCIIVQIAYAEPIQIGIFLGDSYSKTGLKAIKEIEKEYPTIKEQVCFHLYTSRRIKDKKDISNIASSKTIFFFYIHDSQIVEIAKPDIETVIKKGGRVYAVSGPYKKEHQDMGLIDDERITAYYKENGIANIKNMMLFTLHRDFGIDLPYKEPVPVVIFDFGIYLRHRGTEAQREINPGTNTDTDSQIVETLEDFLRLYHPQSQDKWIALTFYKTSFYSGNLSHINAIIDGLEKGGFNVLPVYGYPPQAVIERYLLPMQGKLRLIIGLSLKMGIDPKVLNPLLEKIGVPVINAITLYTQSADEWRKSSVGLDILERVWLVALPEIPGIIQPTVIATKEKMVDAETGMEYVEEKPLPERINQLVNRVKAWINLQDKPNRDKRVAIIYYNYPPGKQNIGASYLNVLPQSLWEILNRLKAEGYDTGADEITKEQLFHDIHRYARNIGNWAQGELDRLVKARAPILIPISTYKQWFKELPEGFKKAVIKDWGEPEECKIMTWVNPDGKKFIVIPAVQYGNILFTPQPSRGWEQDIKKLYHDVTLSPHHQYVAFYLWLKKVFSPDAVAHIGTHGTHEWLNGKEVGFTDCDPPEVLIQDLPNIYPYIVDDVGEGLQAKRRGMAVIIDHMTPPFNKAGLNKELKELAAVINDYNVAIDKSPLLGQARLSEINKMAKQMGLLTDLGLKGISSEEEIEMIEHYIKEIAEKQTPFGLHTFGRSPEEKYRKTTAEAIISIEQNLTDEEKHKQIAEIEERIVKSGQRELDSFIAALSGKYIPAGQGNDPIRNPNSLPTGKNFYSFDPTRIPAKSTYEIGVRLAQELIEGYKQRHGTYPDKLTFNLWSVETIRQEGVMESQIMYLMGIRPKWDERGRVVGVEAIPRSELGRQRIDVTIVPTGLYRDLFSNLMVLLDKAVTLAKEQIEDDNLIRTNVLKTKKMLVEKGIEEDKAERLASVRIFTEPSGAYGTNLSNVIPLSNTWENERQVADVYFMRMSYLYGQGFWGDKGQIADCGLQIANLNPESRVWTEDISLTLFKNALSGTKIAIHGRSSNVYATLDIDDVFQYLGGTAMAIRVIDGKTPEVYITNMSNPKYPKQETLEKFMGREMRTRYLNPEWIKEMMKEGYAGARFIDKIVEHLWGWQVTVPEAVDSAKWNEMYETYVLDKNGLGIKDMFRQAKNMWAYQSIVARMLETVRKNYWKPDKEVIETLAIEYADTVREVGLACCDHTCNNPLLTKFTSSVLVSVPGLSSQVQGLAKALKSIQQPNSPQVNNSQRTKSEVKIIVPDNKGKAVEGYEMKNVSDSGGASSAPIPYLFITGFLAFLGLIMWGWKSKGK
ncbi:MAG: cobaltochelatase subunit CobN [bacterium]